MSWVDQEWAQVKKLWRSGHTTTQISLLVPTKTRNAIAGRLQRHGLMGASAQGKPPKKLGRFVIRSPKDPKGHTPNKARAKKVAVIRETELARSKTGTRASYIPSLELAQLRDDGCLYAMGEIQDSSFKFCCDSRTIVTDVYGNKKKSPYCEMHHKLCNNPTRPVAEMRDVSLVQWNHPGFDPAKKQVA